MKCRPAQRPRQIADSIGPGLARAALAARVNGSIWDLDRPLEGDTSLSILTEQDPEALEVLRHSSAHILATAVRELFPNAGIGFGPPIEDGFYYDFQVDRPFTPEDLQRLEAKMAEVAARDFPFVREVVDRAEANRRFADDPLKLERIAELGNDETITIYTDGPFVDLCRGPHIPRTGRLKHFKLLHAAGAYWRGDEKRQMLQRIYGTAWFKKDDLEAYLHRLEEARRRDHRVLGKQLDLFSIQEVVGPGLVFWHPKGALIKWLLTRAVEDDNVRQGYDLVYTPNITREELFKISGHLPLYEANQYPAMAAGHEEAEDVRYRVKPMNCPMHALIYKSQQRSYRDLPVRLSEVANVYRNERSGVLHGLLRVRGLSMDDAHIFCTMDQVEDEIFLCLDQVDRLVRETFGFELDFEVSTRPPERLGDDAIWDRAESMLRRALERKGIPYRVDEGGGAFYGPKIDIKFRDAIGRLWQGPTIQLDFNLPERFELEYTGRRQPAAPAGHDSSRHLRNARALHRQPDRALCRCISGVAGSGAGAGDPDLRCAGGCGESAGHPLKGCRPSRARGCPRRDAELPDPRRGAAEGAVHGGAGAARSGVGQSGAEGARGGEEAGGDPGRRIHRAGHRRGPRSAHGAVEGPGDGSLRASRCPSGPQAGAASQTDLA